MAVAVAMGILVGLLERLALSILEQLLHDDATL